MQRASIMLLGGAAVVCWLVPALGAAPAPRTTPVTIHYNRDVRPILSDNCFHCHGPDEKDRKADLRLDTRAGATDPRDGMPAIVPGHPEKSLLWKRITTTDPDDLMPPPASHKKLTPEQKEILRAWIGAGAPYQPHWAFVPPQRPPMPPVKQSSWVRTPVDRFILAELEARKLKPSPEAPRETLVRRVKLDLTGLPPSPEEVEAFVKDRRPDAYERMIERFMALPAYGEHQARYWLDAVRYGDTHGLHLDNERGHWPYRDWVVKAFNDNKPFDQFTIEQIAGDLLPNATREQLVASGYNRCNVTTSEGGAIDEEFYVRYAVDRTETTATVWMGLTLGCAVCHDHKYDPISQKEFYRLYAFFNNAADAAMDGNALLPPPSLKLPTPEQEKQLADYEGRIAALEQRIRQTAAGLNYTDPATLTNAPKAQPVEVVWVDDDFPAGAKPQYNGGTPATQWIDSRQGPVHSGQRALKRTASGLAQDFFNTTNALTLGPAARLFAHVYLDPANPPKAIMLQFHSNGWEHRANWGDAQAISYGAGNARVRTEMGPLPPAGQWVRLEVEAEKVGLRAGDKLTGFAFTQFDGTVFWDRAGVQSTPDPASDPAHSLLAWLKQMRALGDNARLPAPLAEWVKQPPEKLKPEQQQKLREHYLSQVHQPSRPVFEPLFKELHPLKEARQKLDESIPSTLIMREREGAQRRKAHVLKRGQYDQPGEEVTPGVPAFLPPLPPSATTNRLDLARWLVSPQHPLTARVIVNRLWQQFFGVGIVKTANDFGMQSDWPSHPELLDWLATEFIAMGWDVKQFQKMLLRSAAYRQDSKVTPKLLEVDPENRLLARGPRFRLDGEVIRDSALFVSGLLNPRMGGRGVRPYQPPGIWEAVGYTTSNTAKYTQDHGEALYRRSLYVFWKRTAPPPIFTTFDAPSRESSCTRRERSNTPLQALLLMNDIPYVECARQLATRMLKEGGSLPPQRLTYGFRLVTGRAPSASEMNILRQSLESHLARYRANTEAARQLVRVGEWPVDESLDTAELAAYTLVANLLLNLDEVVTKN
ncbi:MAG: PSD1 and planctomycete cytochrome C domain-containing protein [Verrucomicrobiae bacterium]|nr:PSD1 and planctomycete cytochrome C domain-containing protein [Verrucomicrobiae bacterium]